MKKLKMKATPTIAKTLATSVFVASCAPNPDTIEFLENQSSDSEKEIADSKGVSLTLNLSDETKKMLLKIAPLVQELTDNPSVAYDLSNDPDAFCAERGV